ncbi:MAG: hypothetical protein ACI4RD_04265 [Kiritimatiellia bacterium]
MQRKLAVSLLAVLIAAAGVGRAVTVGESALLLAVESSGPDCYADGTRAVDGEYYALVAIAPGASFAGFAADGSLVDAENARVLFRLPLACDGRCPKTSVAIDEAVVATGERLLLALLDTRATARSGAAFRVDGWAAVAAPQAVPVSGFGVMSGASSAAMVRSAVPADAPSPRIAAIRREGAEVVLTVADTLNVLDYNVTAGAAPDRLEVSGAARSAVAGDAQRPIELRVGVDEGAACGFFRVVRDGGAQ